MISFVRNAAACAFVLGLCAAISPARAGTKVHATSAFTIKLPAGWTLEPVAVSNDGKRGFWAVSSPKRNGKGYIMIRKRSADSIRDRWVNFVQKFLAQRVGYLTMTDIQDHERPEKGQSVVLGFAYGASRRKQSYQVYKFGILAVDDKARGRVLFAALGGTERNWPKVFAEFGPLVQSIELRQ